MKQKPGNNRKIPFKTNRVGEIFTNNTGYKIEIIGFNGCLDCEIIIDEKHILKNVQYTHIKEGIVKNPYHPAVFGKGYIGIGRHETTINKEKTKKYVLWKSMLERCYGDKYQLKNPTYIGCSVTEEWHNFQNFSEWIEKNYNELYMQDWHLDKDLLIKGNKVYGPKNCSFVPREINTLLTNSKKVRGLFPIGIIKTKTGFQARVGLNDGTRKVIGTFTTPEIAFVEYKKEKEKIIKEVALKYKGKITEKIFDALMVYEISITD